MKAKVEIDVPELHKCCESSYFTVKPGEVLADVLKSHKFTEVEVAEYEMRILKGNQKWVELENEVDVKKAKVANKEKEDDSKREQELLSLKKAEQVELLKTLGVEGKGVPAYEKDRVKMIMRLEKGK